MTENYVYDGILQAHKDCYVAIDNNEDNDVLAIEELENKFRKCTQDKELNKLTVFAIKDRLQFKDDLTKIFANQWSKIADRLCAFSLTSLFILLVYNMLIKIDVFYLLTIVAIDIVCSLLLEYQVVRLGYKYTKEYKHYIKLLDTINNELDYYLGYSNMMTYIIPFQKAILKYNQLGTKYINLLNDYRQFLKDCGHYEDD